MESLKKRQLGGSSSADVVAAAAADGGAATAQGHNSAPSALSRAVLLAVAVASCGAFSFGYHLAVVNGPLEASAGLRRGCCAATPGSFDPRRACCPRRPLPPRSASQGMPRARAWWYPRCWLAPPPAARPAAAWLTRWAGAALCCWTRRPCWRARCSALRRAACQPWYWGGRWRASALGCPAPWCLCTSARWLLATGRGPGRVPRSRKGAKDQEGCQPGSLRAFAVGARRRPRRRPLPHCGQVAPTALRGMLGAVNQVMICVGILAALLVNVALPAAGEPSAAPAGASAGGRRRRRRPPALPQAAPRSVPPLAAAPPTGQAVQPQSPGLAPSTWPCPYLSVPPHPTPPPHLPTPPSLGLHVCAVRAARHAAGPGNAVLP